MNTTTLSPEDTRSDLDIGEVPTVVIPPPAPPKHERHLDPDPTVPSVTVADIWQREHGEEMPADWTHEHRLIDPDTVVLAAMQQWTPLRKAWARVLLWLAVAMRFIERLLPERNVPPVVPPPTVCERTLPVPRYADIVELLQAARGRGVSWLVDVTYRAGRCQWCAPGTPACMRVTGCSDTEVCRECAPIAVRWDQTRRPVTITLPGHAAHLVDDQPAVTR